VMGLCLCFFLVNSVGGLVVWSGDGLVMGVCLLLECLSTGRGLA
jgi:hypothetical protein